MRASHARDPGSNPGWRTPTFPTYPPHIHSHHSLGTDFASGELAVDCRGLAMTGLQLEGTMQTSGMCQEWNEACEWSGKMSGHLEVVGM